MTTITKNQNAVRMRYVERGYAAIVRVIIGAALVCGLCPAISFAQGTVQPTPYQTVFDNSGSIVSGACVWSYVAGTTTPIATYTDVGETTANSNPIIADSAGRFTAFLTPGTSYKFVYETACTPPTHGSVLRTADDITAVPSNSGGVDVVGTAGEALSAGQAVYLSDGSGSKTAGDWYQADTGNAYSSTTNPVGMVTAAIASGATGTIRVEGTVSGLTSLTIGSAYYVGSDGAISTTVPLTNWRRLGVADTTSSLVLQPSQTLQGAQTWTVITITDTGTKNNYAPGLIGNTIIRCNNATDLTLTGLATGHDGQRVRFVSIGAGNVFFADEDSGSDAANQFKNFVTSGKTPLAAGVGTDEYVYDGTSSRWRLTQHQQGAPIIPAFNAADYTAVGATWTVSQGDAATVQYLLSGRTLYVWIILNATTVSAATSTLQETLPGGFTSAASQVLNIMTALDGGTAATNRIVAVALTDPSSTLIKYGRNDAANWSASTDLTYIRGVLTIPIL